MTNEWRRIEQADETRRHKIGLGIGVAVLIAAAIGLVVALETGDRRSVLACVVWILAMVLALAWSITRLRRLKRARAGQSSSSVD